MNDISWLTDAQMRGFEPSLRKPMVTRVDDTRVMCGTIFVNLNGMYRHNITSKYDQHNTRYNHWALGPENACSHASSPDLKGRQKPPDLAISDS